jgi:hypothetical protein
MHAGAKGLVALETNNRVMVIHDIKKHKSKLKLRLQGQMQQTSFSS